LQLQADTQTTVTMLCLTDLSLHVLDKKYKQNKKVGKIQNVKKR